jgi:hypothetical protein
MCKIVLAVSKVLAYLPSAFLQITVDERIFQRQRVQKSDLQTKFSASDSEIRTHDGTKEVVKALNKIHTQDQHDFLF